MLQGSILGPILFLLYVKDLTNSKKSSKIVLYADDMTVLAADKQIDNLYAKPNNTLVLISEWLQAQKALC